MQITIKLNKEMPVAPGTPSIENGAHGTEKLLLKTHVSENFA